MSLPDRHSLIPKLPNNASDTDKKKKQASFHSGMIRSRVVSVNNAIKRRQFKMLTTNSVISKFRESVEGG